MALIDFPSSTDIWRTANFNLVQKFGRIRHEIEQTGAIKTVGTGPDFWEASITIPRKDSLEDASKLEAFLFSLDGVRNWFDYPITRVKRTADSGSMVASVTDDLEYSFDDNTKITDVGTYWNVGDRLYILTKAAPDATFWPMESHAVDTEFLPATKFRCRMIREFQSPGDGDYLGPWSITVREYLGG